MGKYSIGLDFGTESGRAILVDVETGEEVATAVYKYKNGVIDEVLPDGKTKLKRESALQDPDDYIETLKAVIPAVLRESGVRPDEVIGVGVDFTSCTILPTLRDGTPLCKLDRFRSEPHAWVKLWKHHASQPEADIINRVAEERGERFMRRYSRISSEWFFPKVLEIIHDSPEVYEAAERILEAGDWVVWMLTGNEVRSACNAGYKAMWDPVEGYPSKEFLRAVHPMLENVVEEKMDAPVLPPGRRAGGLTERMAELTGLRPGTPVAVCMIDAHAGVPGSSVVEPYKMVMVMGTSTCHMMMTEEEVKVEGVRGVVRDGIIEGYYGHEAGQAAVGDIFAWFVENCVPAEYKEEAERRGVDLHTLLAEKASKLRPGQSGLLALDWWNGCRFLEDADLSGLILGMTLNTKPEEIYRALIEATAFGTRMIIDSFRSAGVPVEELFACGGLTKNDLLMRIYADVTGMEIKVARTENASALGAAILGALAAGKENGGYDDVREAASKMAGVREQSYKPDPENHRIYSQIYEEYLKLHKYFSELNECMKRLKEMRGR
ncbi:ribulokinase [Candidatus Poribacteria bacterium]|nr:MAG: ribulokinase [Candidatus Poribacteria bacterium]